MSSPSKKLQAEWNKKLQKSGFEDIENSQHQLVNYHARKFERNREIVDIEAITQYYRQAGMFLYDYQGFTSKEQKEMWELHSQGLSIRDILKKYPKHTRFHIQETIKPLATKMLAYYGSLKDDNE